MKIIRTLLVSMSCCVVALAAADKSRETCFLAVIFEKGATAEISLDNQGRTDRDVTIQRYSASGKLLDSVTKTVAGRRKTEVRVDLSTETREFGWLRAVEKGGSSVSVSSIYEFLSGNRLASIPEQAVYRHPLSDDAVKSARRYSIRHKYTYDVFALRGVAYFFVNLSNYPVDVGMCQANYPGCTNTTLEHTVLPMASIAFPIDQQARFLVLESNPGFSAGTALQWGDGLTKAFGASSSITFGPVK
jgi:hypothetical protein